MPQQQTKKHETLEPIEPFMYETDNDNDICPACDGQGLMHGHVCKQCHGLGSIEPS